MPVPVSRTEWRRLTGEPKPPPEVCEGCGEQKARCRCLEQALAHQIRLAGLPTPATQHRPLRGRRMAFDFAYPERRLLIEVQGGTRLGQRGGHTSHAGMNRDAEKLNLATLAGWRVLVVTGEQVRSGQALAWIEEALEEATE